jgi:hypothetical protein
LNGFSFLWGRDTTTTRRGYGLFSIQILLLLVFFFFFFVRHFSIIVVCVEIFVVRVILDNKVIIFIVIVTKPFDVLLTANPRGGTNDSREY